MSRDQIIALAFIAGCVVYTFGPDVVRRLVAWFRPEPLAPYRYPGGDQ